MKNLQNLLLLTLMLLLMGCASESVIFKHQGLAGASITTMDAKQRAVVSNKNNKDDPVFLRMCAEPFPDIFTVISSSLSASVRGDGAAKDANAKLGLDFAKALRESGTSIERSQTVNLLAMSLYRTCERYMNDAIDKEQLTLQAMRDQRMMVSILAIEQLTNIARPAPQRIILDSGATEAGTTNSAIALEELIKASKKLETANLELNVATENKTKALAGSAKNDECEFEDASASKQTACKTAIDEFNNISKKLNDAKTYFDKVNKLTDINGAYAKANGSQTPTVINASNPNITGPNALESINKIADTVLRLAELGTTLDNYELCLITARNLYKFTDKDDPDGENSAYNNYKRQIDNCQQLHSKNNLEDLITLNNLSLSTEAAKKSQTFQLYIQSKVDCNECKTMAIKAKQSVSDIQNFKINNYPIEYLDKTKMPENNEIRYFYESDKAAAEAIKNSISKYISKVNIKQLNMSNAKPGVIELWISK